MDAQLEQLIRDAERHAKSKDEWRKSALVSLAVGNGGGLAALAAWSARFNEFERAVELFLTSMWIYACGLVFAGALPFAAWWVTHILLDARGGQRDEEMAKRIIPKGANEIARKEWMIARANLRKEKAKWITPALYLLRALVAGSALCFLTATGLALLKVSEPNAISGNSAQAASEGAPEASRGRRAP